MIKEDDVKAIGKFQKTHALKGELNALLDIDPGYVSDGHAIIIEMDGILVPFFASSIRRKGATSYLVKLDGIDSEDEARNFVNKTIYGKKKELMDFLELTDDDVLDDEEMIGYRVVDSETEESVGRIEDVDTTTDNLLFVVATADGDTVYIPAVDEFIIEIDDDERIIYMNLPEGLVDLNKRD